MALPQLKTATYLMNIPSTGKEVEFRPYTVKEEKVLMIAMESKDQRSIIRALKSVIKDCVESCLLYTSPSPRDLSTSRMPSSA